MSFLKMVAAVVVGEIITREPRADQYSAGQKLASCLSLLALSLVAASCSIYGLGPVLWFLGISLGLVVTGAIVTKRLGANRVVTHRVVTVNCQHCGGAIDTGHDGEIVCFHCGQAFFVALPARGS